MTVIFLIMLQAGFWNSTGDRGFHGKGITHHGWNRSETVSSRRKRQRARDRRPSRSSYPARSFFAFPVERLVRRVVFCASSINDKRALFTASSFGKASATSGLSITMFDDSRTRL